MKKAAQLVIDNLATIGVSLEPCHVPGSTETESRLKANEMEIGMGNLCF